MGMNVEVLTDYLIRISEGKLQLISKLLDLSVQQREALQVVEEEDMKLLNDLIQQKHETIGKIDVLDKEFLDKFTQLKQGLGINSFADLKDEPVVGIKTLKQKIQEIMNITEDIRILDEANTKKAKDNMDQIKQQLKTVKIGKKANYGYGKKFSENPSILIDKKK